jgi:hypothetical protein
MLKSPGGTSSGARPRYRGPGVIAQDSLEIFELRRLVGDENDREVPVTFIEDEFHEFPGGLTVEPGGGFVENQDVGIAHKGPGQGDFWRSPPER